MMRPIAIALASFIATGAQANDGLTSELSHGAGGLAWGSVTTLLVSDRWPENRALIGFGVALSAGLVGEIYDHSRGYGFSSLDVVATAVGGAIGAYVTDKFFLVPVMEKPQQGGRYLGVVARYRF